MQVEFQHLFTDPQERVWEFLQSPEVLKKTLPGCKKFEPLSDGGYDVEMGLSVGPIKGLFTGQVQLLEQEAPHSYRLLMKGRGKPGELQADAKILLTQTDQGTQVSCQSEAHSTGIMASLGQRVMGSVARMILSQFFKSVDTELRKTAFHS